MPVQTDWGERWAVSVFESATKGYAEHNQQRNQTHADVQAVKSSKGETCRGKKIQTNGHASPIQIPVFHPLPSDEDAAQQNCKGKPQFHLPRLCCVLCHFGSSNGKAAGNQADNQADGL